MGPTTANNAICTVSTSKRTTVFCQPARAGLMESRVKDLYLKDLWCWLYTADQFRIGAYYTNIFFFVVGGAETGLVILD